MVSVPVRKLSRFFDCAMAEVGLRGDTASVWLVTNAQMTKWNRAYRGKNKPTDVLSFPSDDEPGANTHGATRRGVTKRRARVRRRSISIGPATAAANSYLGDIAIAPAVARRNARLYGRTLDQELRILIVHGILHLMGYDHETDTGQMERREQGLRRSLGIA